MLSLVLLYVAMGQVPQTPAAPLTAEEARTLKITMKALEAPDKRPEQETFNQLSRMGPKGTGKQLGEVSLGIKLSLKLKGVTLELKGGRINGLRSGECSGEGVLSCQGQPLLKRATPAVPLPGRLAFTPRAAPPAG